MKLNRNDLCLCGSGKKYKNCCLKNENISIYDKFNKIISSHDYSDTVNDVICNMYRYMKQNSWIGACHSTCSVLFVALSELGYKPKICIGEVLHPLFQFDHSWIELEGKIIDLAVSMPMKKGISIGGPIILDIDISTNNKYELLYGINGTGLDSEAISVQKARFIDYMEDYPYKKNGLWGVVEIIYPKNIKIEAIKKNYIDVKREFIINI